MNAILLNFISAVLVSFSYLLLANFLLGKGLARPDRYFIYFFLLIGLLLFVGNFGWMLQNALGRTLLALLQAGSLLILFALFYYVKKESSDRAYHATLLFTVATIPMIAYTAYLALVNLVMSLNRQPGSFAIAAAANLFFLLCALLLDFFMKGSAEWLEYLEQHDWIRRIVFGILLMLLPFFFFNVESLFLGDSTISANLFVIFIASSLAFILSVILAAAVLDRNQTVTKLQAQIINTDKQRDAQTRKLAEELRAFRHDYKNLFLSLQSAIDSGSIESVRRVYGSTIRPVVDKLDSSDYDVLLFDRIKNESLQSLVMAKFMFAQRVGLAMKIDISEDWQQQILPNDELVRVVGNMLDTAISLAVASNDRLLNFSFYSSEEGQGIEIAASYPGSPDQLMTDLHAGKSERALGNHIVENILGHYALIDFQSHIQASLFHEEIMFERP